ncbi:unnamed protein product, partial [Effrenium voratum]
DKRKDRLDELFKELDSSGDGTLDASEVKHLLTSLADGREPDEEELGFIMKTSGCQASQRISREQLAGAIESWTLYLQEFGNEGSAGKVLFDKHDKSQTGKLDREELAGLLQELAGRPASEADLDWILAKA